MPTTQAVHAFVLAALDDAIGRLDRGGSISDDNLHQLRKAVKRARAGLRLLRHAISDDSLRKENALLRDTGRAFAAIRDRASLIEALDLLDAGRKEPATPVRRRQIELAGKLLRARRASARRAFLGSSVSLDAAKMLAKCRRRVARWRFARPSGQGIPGDLERIYRKGRRAFAHAARTPTPEALHEWRKQVKYLQNALLALYGNQPGTAKLPAARRLGDATDLSEALGEGRDLWALGQELQAAARTDVAEVAHGALDTLLARILRKRKKLARDIFSTGRHLYERKPARFLELVAPPGGATATGPG